MNETEWLAAKTTDLQNGEMKEITINETKIVLAKVEGQFYAVGGICPHYKAPLAEGALCGTKLYCPWHHSVFDITNGKFCEPPTIDDIPHYKIVVKGADVYIKLPEKERANKPVEKNGKNKTFVVLGGGAAGLMAVQILRSEGFGGRLILITKENDLPYDRPSLSKTYMSGEQKEEELPLRNEDFFQDKNIEVEKNKEVKKVDATTKTIEFANNEILHYDSLLLATGSQPNKLNVAGANLPNVFTLRSADNAKTILNEARQSKNICLIGASFIAMEVAASLTTLGSKVTVIAREKLPFEKNFGEAIAQLFYNMHTQKGVVIKTNAEVASIEGKTKAEAVVLKSGERIETDMIVVGIGVHPITDYIAGIELNDKDKSVPVDEHLQAADGLFAAGDIARFANNKWGQPVRIEHWRVAEQQGKIAALNMLGEQHSVNETMPFFWTYQFEESLSYVGHAESWDDIVIDGNVNEKNFSAYYVQNQKVLAVASMGRDVESDKIEDIMVTNDLLTVDEIKQKIGSGTK